MNWFVEHLQRDGSVLARVPVPAVAANAADGSAPPHVLKIGRALDNDLVLDDPHCAAHHAQLEIAADGSARLVDLGSRNGIVAGRRRAAVHEVKDDTPVRLGQSVLRVRSSAWPLAPEVSLSRRAAWPIALLLLALVLGNGAWDVWIRDVQEKSPPYLYGLAALAAGLCIWSAFYAVLGRLIGGSERFFSHLSIACAGYIAVTVILNALELLAFSTSWLWPVRITQPVFVIIAALTVRQHLRLADPRHWPALRWAVGIVAATAVVLPLAQLWVSHQRLTNVQTLDMVEHPALRLAKPVSIDAFSQRADALKKKVDEARRKKQDGADSDEPEGDDQP
jgi:FHA domain